MAAHLDGAIQRLGQPDRTTTKTKLGALPESEVVKKHPMPKRATEATRPWRDQETGPPPAVFSEHLNVVSNPSVSSRVEPFLGATDNLGFV